MDNVQHAILGQLFCVLTDYEESVQVSHALRRDSRLQFLSSFREGLIKHISCRGWKDLLLVDFPEACKAFDKCLSTGFLSMESFPHYLNPPRNERLMFTHWFHSLLLPVVDTQGRLRDPSEAFHIEHVTFIRQILSMFKKLKIDCPKERIANASKEFFSIELDLRYPSGTWDSDVYIPQRFKFLPKCHSGIKVGSFRALLGITDFVAGVCIPTREVDTLGIIPRHGPGAVSDGKTGTDKYLFPFWPTKLEGTFPYSYFGKVNEGYHLPFGPEGPHDPSETHEPSPIEPSAKLIAVPKTYKGPRLIASEPTAQQFLQQGLLRWIRDNLTSPLRSCIDFLDQQPSQDAALRASISGDSATVDLSSASDRLTCWTVERVFGANQSLLRHLHAVRTRTIVDGTGSSDMSIKLKKFAAQGSAVTFPVQSIAYAIFCIAAVIHSERLPLSVNTVKKVARKVRVFGDDIVLPSSATKDLERLLRYNNLRVNMGKTHTTGHFRESCGVDAYRGYNVSPVYVSTSSLGTRPSAQELTSWVDVSNNAHSSGLWTLSSWYIEEIPALIRRKLIISHDEGPGIRLFSYSIGTLPTERIRWNRDLHVIETLCLTNMVRAQKESRGSSNDLLDYFLQAPSPDVLWKHGYVTRNSCKLLQEWAPVILHR